MFLLLSVTCLEFEQNSFFHNIPEMAMAKSQRVQYCLGEVITKAVPF